MATAAIVTSAQAGNNTAGVPSEVGLPTTVSATGGSGVPGVPVTSGTPVVTRPHLAPKPNLEKRDSFEGHEEAVRTIVEAVQESRIKQQKKDG